VEAGGHRERDPGRARGLHIRHAILLAVLAVGHLRRQVSGGPSGSYIVPAGIRKIKHVIIVMQENRSFDTYFGTYPGADGIPMANGAPTVCGQNPTGPCTRPYHDTADVNGGGPHGEANAAADVNGGRMDGFIIQRDQARPSCTNPDDPACDAGGPA
jgi:phospholipase C